MAKREVPRGKWMFARLQANGALSRVGKQQGIGSWLKHVEYDSQEAAEKAAPVALAGMRPGHRESQIVLIHVVKTAEVTAQVTLTDFKQGNAQKEQV